MGLKEQQDLLARLYTDKEFADGFFDAPLIAGRNEVSDKEVNEIANAARSEIEFFADSLISKRLREVEKLLPLTSQYFADNFRPIFREFAKTFNPTSTKKHLEDALAFTAFLVRKTTIASDSKDIARFESAMLGHHSYQRRLTACFVSHDVRPLLRPDRSELPNIPKRKGVALWLRVGSRTRFLFL